MSAQRRHNAGDYPRDNGASIVIREVQGSYDLVARRVRSARLLGPSGRWGLVRVGRGHWADSYTVADRDLGLRAEIEETVERLRSLPGWLDYGEYAVDWLACPEVTPEVEA